MVNKSKSKNLERIKSLKLFIKKTLPLLKELNISPVLWGSLAYVHYTKDLDMEINDADFLIPMKDHKKLLSMIKKSKIKYNYVEGWDCIQIFDGDLMIEFDPIERYHIEKFEKIKFGDIKLDAISLEDLTRRYKLASKSKKVAAYSKKKIRDYRKKYTNLLNV